MNGQKYGIFSDLNMLSENFSDFQIYCFQNGGFEIQCGIEAILFPIFEIIILEYFHENNIQRNIF